MVGEHKGNKQPDDLRKFRWKLKAEDRLTREEANDRDGVSERAKTALEAKISPDDLTEKEQEVWIELFATKMAKPGPNDKAFFAERQRKGLGAGLDENRRLVRGSDK